MGDMTLCVANFKHNSYYTMYPNNVVYFRYIIVNTMHKNDNNTKKRNMASITTCFGRNKPLPDTTYVNK
jgi:hypothetical protein